LLNAQERFAKMEPVFKSMKLLFNCFWCYNKSVEFSLHKGGTLVFLCTC